VADLDGETVPDVGEHELAPVIGKMATFAGLEELLRGARVGDEKETELEFPESYRHQSLAGRTVPGGVRVKAGEASEVPEIAEAFAEGFGVDGGVDQLRADEKKTLEREMRQAVADRIKRAVTDGLAARYSDLDIPASAVDHEIGQMQEQMQQQT